MRPRQVRRPVPRDPLINAMMADMNAWLDGSAPVPRAAEITNAWQIGRWNFDRKTDSAWSQREAFIGAYGFAVPSAELVAVLKRHAPILEVAAGTGYMTKLMRANGVDVIGSDGHGESYQFYWGAHDPQQLVAKAEVIVRQHPDRAVFCSWPSYDDSWFGEMLEAMPAGQKLIVIRESATARDCDFEHLEKHFAKIANAAVPNFYGINDWCEVWRK